MKVKGSPHTRPVTRSQEATVLAAVLALGTLSSACAATRGTERESVTDEAPLTAFEALPARLRHPATGIVLVRLPAGTFERGSPPEEHGRDGDEVQITVAISGDVYLAETEVTVGQWERLMGVDFDAPPRDPNLPIGDVTWYDVQEFVRRLNEEGPAGWRLPSEDEWEYACRAGTTTPFAFGEDLRADQANFDPYYPYRATPRGEHSLGPKVVRSYPPNAWGFFDLHGNVAEWCEDLYVAASGAPPAAEGAARVFRGGAWLSSADQVRSAWREGYPPKSDGHEYGFRVAWSSASSPTP